MVFKHLRRNIVFAILFWEIRCHCSWKVFSLYSLINFLATVYTTSPAGLVGEVGTRQSRQNSSRAMYFQTNPPRRQLWRTAAVLGKYMALPSGWNTNRTAIFLYRKPCHGMMRDSIVPILDPQQRWSLFTPITKTNLYMKICQHPPGTTRLDGLACTAMPKVKYGALSIWDYEPASVRENSG